MNIDFKTYHQFDTKFDGKKKCPHECYSSGVCPFNISEDKIPCAEEYPYVECYYNFPSTGQQEIYKVLFNGTFLMKINENEASAPPSISSIGKINITEPGEYRIRYYTNTNVITNKWDFFYIKTISSINFSKMKLDKFPSSTFANGQALKTIIGLEQIKTFASACCRDCQSLTSQNFNLLEAERIEYYAFYNCQNLKKVIVGPKCNFIGVTSFGGNVRDRVYVFQSKTPPTMDGNAFYLNPSPTIYVPADSLNLYKTATNWSAWASRIFPMAT